MVKTGEKLAYAVGDMGICMMLDVVYTFQLLFYTEVLGFGAAVAGGVIFVARTLGSFFDVPAGLLADRTRSRWGRFRPWVVGMSPLLMVLFVLTFLSPSGGIALKAGYATVTLSLFMLVVSLQNTPYSALGGVMSGDEKERAGIASWRVLGSLGSGLVVSVGVPKLAPYLGTMTSPQTGWVLTVLIFAIVALPLLVISGVVPKERVAPARRERISVAASLPAVFHTPGALAVLLAGVAFSLAGGFSSNGFVYYFNHVSDGVIGYPAFGFTSQLVTGCAVLFITVPLTRRFSAVKVATCAYLGTAALSCVYFFLPTSAAGSLLTVCAMRSVVYAPATALFWTLLARVADRSGGAATALVFGLACMLNKIASAAGNSLFGCGLSLADYVPGEAFTASTSLFVRLSISFIPAAFLLGAAVLVRLVGKDQENVAIG